MKGITAEFKKKINSLADNLSSQEYWVCDQVFEIPELILLTEYFNNNISNMKPASIGKGQSKSLASEIRNDSILWLEKTDQKLGLIHHVTQIVSQILRNELFLPIRSLETQMAIYEKGHFYKRHQDRHTGTDARWVTSVIYLNENWTNEHGGELKIYPKLKQDTVTIEPVNNRIIVFLSELEHEVLPSNTRRKSITTWYRDDI